MAIIVRRPLSFSVIITVDNSFDCNDEMQTVMHFNNLLTVEHLSIRPTLYFS